MGGGVPHLIRVCNAGRADVETTIQSPLPQKQDVCAAFVSELSAVCGLIFDGSALYIVRMVLNHFPM